MSSKEYQIPDKDLKILLQVEEIEAEKFLTGKITDLADAIKQSMKPKPSTDNTDKKKEMLEETKDRK